MTSKKNSIEKKSGDKAQGKIVDLPKSHSKSGMQLKTNGEKSESKKKRLPDFNVFAVVPRGESMGIGANIGRVFNHHNGTGFKIFLDAAPIPHNGKIELVAFAPKP